MRNVWIITASMTVLAICYTMIIPFCQSIFGIRCSKDDVALWSGLVFGITFSLPGLWRPYGVRLPIIRAKTDGLASWFCHRRICYFLIGLVTDQYLLLGRAFVGFANGFYPAAMTMVSLSVDEKQVGRALGIFQTGLILGNVIGPF